MFLIGLMRVYFIFPLLMLMRAGFQKGVPTVLLGRLDAVQGWTFEPLGAAIQADRHSRTHAVAELHGSPSGRSSSRWR